MNAGEGHFSLISCFHFESAANPSGIAILLPEEYKRNM